MTRPIHQQKLVLWVGGPRHGEVTPRPEHLRTVATTEIGDKLHRALSSTYVRRRVYTGHNQIVDLMATPEDREPPLDLVIDALAIAAGVAQSVERPPDPPDLRRQTAGWQLPSDIVPERRYRLRVEEPGDDEAWYTSWFEKESHALAALREYRVERLASGTRWQIIGQTVITNEEVLSHGTIGDPSSTWQLPGVPPAVEPPL